MKNKVFTARGDMGKQCETRESGSYCKSYSNDGETQDHRGGSEEDKVPEYEGNR